jgi:unsaturated chondroitin disaccharide hydrolase
LLKWVQAAADNQGVGGLSAVAARAAARRNRIRMLTLAAGVLIVGTPVAHASLENVVRDDLELARERLAATAAAVPPDRYPAWTGPDGMWTTTGSKAWTSGFFPGTLWLAYGATGDTGLRAEAEKRLGGLEAQKRDTSGNDQGFKILGSFGNAARLTGDDEYRRVVVRAARPLASRFVPVIGATRSWGGRSSPEVRVIVDNLMNLELLFWASKHGGDPAWFAIAQSHALRTMRDHVRSDGSTYHVVDYGPATGAVERKGTRQGRARDTTWSRGQAWAVYGFTMAYRETGDRRLLAAARRVSDWFLDHLPPDRVPYWDFDAPGIPDAPRDSSAAAIAASGLLELAALEPDSGRAAGYSGAAESIIASLSRPPYLAPEGASQAILLHGTQDFPRGNFDTGLAFGDYYFVEALGRYLSPPRPPDESTIEVRRLHGANGRRVEVAADEPGRVEAALLAGPATARKLDLDNLRSAVLGRGNANLGDAGEAELALRLTARAARRLRGARNFRATLCVVLETGRGQPSATTVPLAL